MPAPIPLWSGVAPGSPDTPHVRRASMDPRHTDTGDHPHLVPFLLDDGSPHPLVLVVPGGGYGQTSGTESNNIAEYFNQAGLHAAVLHYRVGPRHHHPAMIHDAQRAMRLIRRRAQEWRIRPTSAGTPAVGAIGFSAGGHLAASLAVHHDRFPCPQDDLAGSVSARPDAVALCYPVIDLTQFVHHGSLLNLLGPHPDPALIELMSLHRHVRDDSPPAFLWHTADDGAVRYENSVAYFQACRAHKVRSELHIYESGTHGLNLAEKHATISTWGDLCRHFFQRHLS